MTQQKALYERRGALNTIILMVLFLLVFLSFYNTILLIFQAFQITNVLQIVVNSVFLISLIGFWYLRRWAILSSAIVVLVGGIVTVSGFNEYIGVVILWLLFIGHIHKKWA